MLSLYHHFFYLFFFSSFFASIGAVNLWEMDRIRLGNLAHSAVMVKSVKRDSVVNLEDEYEYCTITHIKHVLKKKTFKIYYSTRNLTDSSRSRD